MRVIVWGPGGLGMLAIREIVMLREFELVGVWAYSSKNSVDSGTLSGIEPDRVPAPIDVEALLRLEADVILYCARDLATSSPQAVTGKAPATSATPGEQQTGGPWSRRRIRARSSSRLSGERRLS